MFKISIPKPCFEGWENMTPNEQGRYCNACAKTVIDFSVMSDEAVQEYFISNYGSKTCGRFKNTQLQRIVIDLPKNIFGIPLPFWKKFLVAFLIIYGSSFFSIDTTIAGTPYQTFNTFYEKSRGTPVIKKDKQKKRHKRRKYRFTLMDLPTLGIISSCPSPPSIVTEGFTVIEKIPPPPLFDTSGFINITESTIADTGTTVKNNANSVPKKKTPKPKAPDPTTAFILPSALALRKPFSKKKKA